MKKNIVKYTEDVAELLRQKDKYHLSDDVYEKRLREAKVRESKGEDPGRRKIYKRVF